MPQNDQSNAISSPFSCHAQYEKRSCHEKAGVDSSILSLGTTSPSIPYSNSTSSSLPPLAVFSAYSTDLAGQLNHTSLLAHQSIRAGTLTRAIYTLAEWTNIVAATTRLGASIGNEQVSSQHCGADPPAFSEAAVGNISQPKAPLFSVGV